jgi:small-conductance mechanosensitive channel
MTEVQGAEVTSGTNAQATSGAAVETSGSTEKNQTKTESTVSSEHALKLKKELENWRSKAKELEQRQLEAEGQKDKVIEMLREELGTMKKTQAEMLRSKVRDQVAVKASELGCLNPDLMLKAIDVDQFEVDSQSLRVTDSERLLKTIEEFKKANPYMFKQTGPSVKDGVPATSPNTKLDLAKMSKKELIEYAKAKGIN